MEGLTLQCMWTNLGRSLEHNYLYSTTAASGPFPGSLRRHSSDHLQYCTSQKLSLARVHDLHDVIICSCPGNNKVTTIKIVMHGDAAPFITHKICMWAKEHLLDRRSRGCYCTSNVIKDMCACTCNHKHKHQTGFLCKMILENKASYSNNTLCWRGSIC